MSKDRDSTLWIDPAIWARWLRQRAGPRLLAPERSILADRPQPPWPLMEVAIEARSAGDLKSLETVLDNLMRDDTSFRAIRDPNSDQILVGGLDERHLEFRIDLLRLLFHFDLSVGAPQVACRETPTCRAEIDYTHKRQTSGGADQFARVKIAIDPRERGEGLAIETGMVASKLPPELILGAEKGLASVLAAGMLVGSPVTDISVSLIDAARHDEDSTPLAFQVAARAGLREALQLSAPVVLEPIMAVEVVAAEEFEAPIVADLRARRGVIHRVERRLHAVIVSASVPLANMFGYENGLRAISGGRARFGMRYARYEPLPTSSGNPPPSAPALALRA